MITAASHSDAIVRWFGHVDDHVKPPRRKPPLPLAGQIALITGPSGSGKTRLLRRYRRIIPAPARIELGRIALPRRPVIDLFEHMALPQALGILGRVGLAEARAMVGRPDKLSAGQRWRLRLGLAISMVQDRPRTPVVYFVCDDFAALLDRVSAAALARVLRRTVDRCPHLAALIATSHDDLLAALRPDLLIACDFEAWEVVRRPATEESK